MLTLARKFMSDESGMEMVEYAVFAAALVLAALAGATLLWGNVQAKFSQVAQWIMNPS